MAFVFALTVSSIGAVPFCMYAAGRHGSTKGLSPVASGIFIGGFMSLFGPIGWIVATSMLEDAGDTQLAQRRRAYYSKIKSDKRHAKYIKKQEREEQYRLYEEQRELDIKEWVKTHPGQCYDCGYVWCQCGDWSM